MTSLLEDEPYKETKGAVRNADGIAFLGQLLGNGRILWIGAACGLFLSLAYLAFSAFFLPGTTTYRQAILLSAAGSQTGAYPNGTRFAPSDLRGGLILSKVYAASNLQQFGITLADLDSALSVSAYTPALEQTNLRFRALLNQPGLSPEARRQLDDEYRAAISSLDGVGALVSLGFGDDQKVPPETAKSVLAGIIGEWARLYVDQLGVAAAPNVRDAATLVNQEMLTQLDIPQAYQAIGEAQGKLDLRIAELSVVPGLGDIALENGKRRLNDIKRESEANSLIGLSQILMPLAHSGIARDAEMTKVALANAIADDKAESERLIQSIRQIDEIVAQSISPGTSSNAAQAVATTSQLGDATVERLLDLAVENADLPFRRKLLTEKKELGSKLAALLKRSNSLDRIYSAILSAQAVPVPNSAKLIARFEAAAVDVSTTQNRLWDQMNQLAELSGGQNIDNSKQIYVSVPIADEVVRSGGIGERVLWLKALVLFATFVAGGIVLQLGRSALRPAE